MKNIVFSLILAVSASIALVGYAEESKQETAVPVASQSATKEKLFVATVGNDGVQRVAIIAGEYFFDPNRIIVKVNVPVEFTIMKVKGIVPHDIMVKAPDAGIDFKVDLSDKDPKKIKFTPTKTGSYEMICDKKLLFFKSHEDRGMKGTIEVAP